MLCFTVYSNDLQIGIDLRFGTGEEADELFGFKTVVFSEDEYCQLTLILVELDGGFAPLAAAVVSQALSYNGLGQFYPPPPILG